MGTELRSIIRLPIACPICLKDTEQSIAWLVDNDMLSCRHCSPALYFSRLPGAGIGPLPTGADARRRIWSGNSDRAGAAGGGLRRRACAMFCELKLECSA